MKRLGKQVAIKRIVASSKKVRAAVAAPGDVVFGRH
jgi:hypothetical protein